MQPKVRHTALGLRSLGAHLNGCPVVTVATAHPAKFPDAVFAATGIRPSLPAHLADLLDRTERTNLVANDLAAVQTFVERAVAR